MFSLFLYTVSLQFDKLPPLKTDVRVPASVSSAFGTGNSHWRPLLYSRVDCFSFSKPPQTLVAHALRDLCTGACR